MTRLQGFLSSVRWGGAGALLILVGCASEPATPDWALQAKASLDRAVRSYLSAEPRLAQADFERARQQLARSGRVDLVARAELMRCAAQFAGLEPAAQAGCPGFEPLRGAATPADQAYANFLQGRWDASSLPLLPVSQQPAAAAGLDAARRLEAVRAIADPLGRLVAAAAALRDGVTPPGLSALAIETASAQGWRRPLAAWLTLDIRRATQAGDGAAAQALQQRLDVVLSSDRSVRSQATP
jgi:hypothetical protein